MFHKMFLKIILTSSFLVQTISGQYINGAYPGVYPTNLVAETAALANNFAIHNRVPEQQIGTNGVSNGGTFIVKSHSPIAPNGVNVQSENLAIEGPVAVSGQLPFLGVVSLEGPLPSTGHGSVAYGCGNGNVGILNEAEGYPGASGYINAGFNAGIPNSGFINAGNPNPGFINAGITNANAALANPGFVNAANIQQRIY